MVSCVKGFASLMDYLVRNKLKISNAATEKLDASGFMGAECVVVEGVGASVIEFIIDVDV